MSDYANDYKVVQFANGTYGVYSKRDGGYMDKDFLRSWLDRCFFMLGKYSEPYWWATPSLIARYSQTSERRAKKLCHAIKEKERLERKAVSDAEEGAVVVAYLPCE